MTHYRVAILSSNEDVDIKKLLAPYSEHLRVAPYISRTKQEMIKDAKEYKENYSSLPDDEKKEWMEKYFKATTDEELYATQVYNDEKYDSEGNELSTYNPNSKWDYYTEMETGKVSEIFERMEKARKEDEWDYFPTYALLLADTGEWLAPGNVGWFGTDDATEEATKEYYDNYEKYIRPYEYYVLVDCHI